MLDTENYRRRAPDLDMGELGRGFPARSPVSHVLKGESNVLDEDVLEGLARQKEKREQRRGGMK